MFLCHVPIKCFNSKDLPLLTALSLDLDNSQVAPTVSFGVPQSLASLVPSMQSQCVTKYRNTHVGIQYISFPAEIQFESSYPLFGLCMHQDMKYVYTTLHFPMCYFSVVMLFISNVLLGFVLHCGAGGAWIIAVLYRCFGLLNDR